MGNLKSTYNSGCSFFDNTVLVFLMHLSFFSPCLSVIPQNQIRICQSPAAHTSHTSHTSHVPHVPHGDRTFSHRWPSHRTLSHRHLHIWLVSHKDIFTQIILEKAKSLNWKKLRLWIIAFPEDNFCSKSYPSIWASGHLSPAPYLT